MSETHQDKPIEGGLSLWDAVSIIVGIVIGASIFRIPWLVFANVTDPLTGLGVWVIGGLLALVGALCYSELATTYPRSGGDYEYLSRAYGPWAGFLFGWAQLVLILTASIGAMAYVFAEYAVGIWDFGGSSSVGISTEFLYATAAVFLLTALNVLGVTFGKTTQNILTITKILGLGAILVAGFVWAQPGKWGPPPDMTNIGWGALAMILVLYAYGGWNDAAFVAAEVRNRKTNIPLALIFGTGAITLIYLLVNAAYILGLGFADAQKPGLLPALVLQRTPLGEWGAKVISVLIMISALGAVNGLIFTGSRVYATLGSDYRLFAFMGGWKPGRGAPVAALIAQAIITLLLILVMGTKYGHDTINNLLGLVALRPTDQWQAGSAFETLVSHTAPIFWMFFLMTGISLFVLRARDPNVERPFRVPFYPILPLIFCGMCVYMLYESTIYVKQRVLFAVVLLSIGLPLYGIARLFGKPDTNETVKE